jgi:anthranilate/para-aminobenzoate synthase component I
VKFSEIDNLESFALLGPGFADGLTLLCSGLRDATAPPLLIFARFESDGRHPQTFGADEIEEITVDPDLRAASPEIILDESEYTKHIAEIREAIARGDVYQVCYTRRAHLNQIAAPDLASIFCRNGMPHYFAWVRLPNGEEFISASPELFFEVNGRIVHTQPMKGTARAGDGSVLELSEKDRAELAMITDLLRNDLTPVCKPRSVHVVNERQTVELPYAIQTVSNINGALLDDITPLDVLASLHPGGSVTGAPKQAALGYIRKMEPTPRGPYCGSLGSWRGDRAVFSILIRTATKAPDGWIYGVGSGVVYDSDADSELRELHIKLGALRNPQ